MDEEPTSKYEEDISYIHELLIGISGQLSAIETVLGAITKHAGLESEVCKLSGDSTAMDKLVPPADWFESSERRSRQLYLATVGWNETFIAILRHAPEHLEPNHECEE